MSERDAEPAVACPVCGKPCPQHRNLCSWECHIAEARANGAVEHCPNGLPVKCITADGRLLECEDGDHPDYVFPVKVCHGDDRDLHALIYADESMALTLYECCYFMWHLDDGSGFGGSIQHPEERLAGDSIDAIKAHVAKRRGAKE